MRDNEGASREYVEVSGHLATLRLRPARDGVLVIEARRLGETEPLRIDEVKIVSAKQREAFVEKLPEGLREDASRLLERHAQEFVERPAAPKDLQGRSLLLADVVPWPCPVRGEVLYQELLVTFKRFLALPEGASTAMALWVLHAYAHDAALVSPILVFASPEKRCGKTTALTLLRFLVPRPLLASNISSAALFRAVEKYRPTLLVDEADAFMRENEELRGIVNSGHVKSGATVVRTVGEDFEPRTFSTWAPKAIALIGRLPGTLEDRSVIIRMRRRGPGEAVERFRVDRDNEFEPLKRQAARWTADNLAAIRDSDPTIPDGLHDRAADNWRPLLAIAALVAPWALRDAHRVAQRLSGGDDLDSSVSVQLLSDLRELFFEHGADRIPSGQIVQHLGGMEDRPWADYRAGRPLTQAQLARLLKPFGILPRVIRIEGGTPRGYSLEDFADAFSRYLQDSTTQQAQQAASDAVARDSNDRNKASDVAPLRKPVEPLISSIVAPVADPATLLTKHGWWPDAAATGEGSDA